MVETKENNNHVPNEPLDYKNKLILAPMVRNISMLIHGIIYFC